jgi:hypothetical protein
MLNFHRIKKPAAKNSLVIIPSYQTKCKLCMGENYLIYILVSIQQNAYYNAVKASGNLAYLQRFLL